MALTIPKQMKPVVDFAIQVVIGVAAFTVVALAAVFLSAIVLEVQHLSIAPEWLIGGLHWLEWGVFWTDAFCFVLFLVSEVIKLLLGLWRELSEL